MRLAPALSLLALTTATASRADVAELRAAAPTWPKLFARYPEGFRFDRSDWRGKFQETHANKVIAQCGVELPITFDESLFTAFAKKKPEAPPRFCDRVYESAARACKKDDVGRAAVAKHVRRVVCRGDEDPKGETLALEDGVLTYTVGNDVGDNVSGRGPKRDVFFEDLPSAEEGFTVREARAYAAMLTTLENGTGNMAGTKKVAESCGVALSLDVDRALLKRFLGTGNAGEQGCRHLVGLVYTLCRSEKPDEQALAKRISGVACRFDEAAPHRGTYTFKDGVLSVAHGATLGITNDEGDVAAVRAALGATPGSPATKPKQRK